MINKKHNRITRFQVVISFLLTIIFCNIAKASNIIYHGTGDYFMPIGVSALIEAYPEMGMTYNNNFIIFKDGTGIIYDDKIDKTYLEMLDNCDVEDMFKTSYDRYVTLPPYLYDPGRYRCEELFHKMYGKDANEISRSLTTVKIFGKNFNVTRINGVDEKLRKVAEEVEKHSEFKEFFTKNSGGYNYRKVRGNNRLSAHSYGIAIDINSVITNYWERDYKVSEIDLIGYSNSVPYELVKIFEDNGFIWGGRWYHYDTMHFEYRPELLRIKN